MDKIKIIGSFSGGESSAMLVDELEKFDKNKYDIKYCFMNTSREDERTLVFVDQIDRYYGLNLTWLQAVVNPIRGKGIGFEVTNFQEAKRNGEVFEPWIKKYGMHGLKNPGCTRDLKAACCDAWAKSIGFKNAKRAIGLRYDEPKRVNLIKAKEKNQIYPLWEKQIVKADVKKFWAGMLFQLGLKEWEGNCKLCFKTSLRKLLTQIHYDPGSAEWLISMERKYPNNPLTGEKTYMFRGKQTIFDLIELAKQPFDLWKEPIYSDSDLYDVDLDEQESCSDSCEAFI